MPPVKLRESKPDLFRGRFRMGLLQWLGQNFSIRCQSFKSYPSISWLGRLDKEQFAVDATLRNKTAPAQGRTLGPSRLQETSAPGNREAHAS